MQKILFHDVDGCLNTIDGIALPFKLEFLLESQKAALRTLGKTLDDSDMDMMVLNTGRSLDAALVIAKAIDSSKVKYVIAEHGALGYCLSESNQLDLADHARSLPHLGGVYSTVSKIPTLINWYQIEGAALLAREIDILIESSPKQANLTLEVPVGICGANMMTILRQLIEQHSPVADDALVYHHAESDGYVDVMAEVDKGDGVQVICHLESHGAIQSFAVGNGLNDIPMFESVDFYICPANSEETLVDFCKKNNGFVSEHAYIDATLELLRTMDSFGS